MTTTTRTKALRARWAGLLLAALAAVLAMLLPAGTASASGLPAAQTRVGVSTLAAPEVVGVHECITAGQRRSRAPSQLQVVSGHCVAAEAGVEAGAAGSGQVTVLGRYTGGVDGYVGKPGFNTLDLPFKGTGRWYWSRNKAFIDDAIERGDELRLVTNPNEPLYQGGNVYQRELRYLRDRGYSFQQTDDYWLAVPGR